MKKLKMKVEIGSKLEMEVQVLGFDENDQYLPVKVEFTDEHAWLTREAALAAGIVEEVEREPQVGDVYKDSDGSIRILKLIDGEFVYYTYQSNLNLKLSPSAGEVYQIKKWWGELQ